MNKPNTTKDGVNILEMSTVEAVIQIASGALVVPSDLPDFSRINPLKDDDKIIHKFKKNDPIGILHECHNWIIWEAAKKMCALLKIDVPDDFGTTEESGKKYDRILTEAFRNLKKTMVTDEYESIRDATMELKKQVSSKKEKFYNLLTDVIKNAEFFKVLGSDYYISGVTIKEGNSLVLLSLEEGDISMEDIIQAFMNR